MYVLMVRMRKTSRPPKISYTIFQGRILVLALLHFLAGDFLEVLREVRQKDEIPNVFGINATAVSREINEARHRFLAEKKKLDLCQGFCKLGQTLAKKTKINLDLPSRSLEKKKKISKRPLVRL